MTTRTRFLKFCQAVSFAFLCILPGPVHLAFAADSLLAGVLGDESVLWSPGKIALDTEKALYVVDGYRNRVLKFDSTGSRTGAITVERPSAVAVGRDGALYIGTHRDYAVAIYRNGERTGSLGEGSGEFSSVLDIAVDKDLGDIYVADGVKNAVTVYTEAGAPRASFAGFNSPVAVAVTFDAVYVLDAPAAGSGAGSRISVFSKNGTFQRSIDERGRTDGAMMKPADIAVDSFGNVYVADAGRKAVIVYDKQGILTGEMTAAGINTPVSLVVSPDNRIYVSSSETHNIVEIPLAGKASAAAGFPLDFKSKTGDRLTPAALGY